MDPGNHPTYLPLAGMPASMDAVEPADNDAGVPTFAKWVLILDMLLGRLKI